MKWTIKAVSGIKFEVYWAIIYHKRKDCVVQNINEKLVWEHWKNARLLNFCDFDDTRIWSKFSIFGANDFFAILLDDCIIFKKCVKRIYVLYKEKNLCIIYFSSYLPSNDGPITKIIPQCSVAIMGKTC